VYVKDIEIHVIVVHFINNAKAVCSITKEKVKLSKAKQAVISAQHNYKDRYVFFLLPNLV